VGYAANSRLTKWRILTSSGGSVGKTFIIISAGVITGTLYVSKRPTDKVDSPGVATLTYKGIGAGIGLGLKKLGGLPDVSYSSRDMPSSGDICHGPLSSGKDIELTDLTGICVIRVISGGAIGAAGVTQIFFQPDTTALPELCLAVGTIPGIGRSTPGISAMEYPGYLRISNISPDMLVSKDIPIKANRRHAIFLMKPHVLAMPADILFDFGSARLKLSADQALRQAVKKITEQRVRSVTIKGYTDSIGTDEYNLRLSQNRADAVRDWLLRNGLANAKGYLAIGMGETNPVAPNTKPNGTDNPEGRRKNRRVEFILF